MDSWFLDFNILHIVNIVLDFYGFEMGLDLVHDVISLPRYAKDDSPDPGAISYPEEMGVGFPEPSDSLAPCVKQFIHLGHFHFMSLVVHASFLALVLLLS